MGGTEIRVRHHSKSIWVSWIKVGPEEIVSPVSFNKEGDALILESSILADTARVVERTQQGGAERIIAQTDEVDAEQIMLHPTEYHVQAVSFAPGRSHWNVIDAFIKGDFEAIRKIHDGDFSIIIRDHADKTWLVAFQSDREPIRYYAFDRATKSAEFLFVHQPKLEGLQLAAMKHVVIPSRDGFKLNSY